MPFDAAAQPFVAPVAAPVSRRTVNDLTLGVFSHDGEWKIYSPFDKPAQFDTRESAIAAAQDKAQQAARAGRRVELFVQEEDGAFRQAAIALG